MTLPSKVYRIFVIEILLYYIGVFCSWFGCDDYANFVLVGTYCRQSVSQVNSK